MVRSTSEQMLTTLRAEKETIQDKPERIYGLVEKIVLPHFDFKRMAQWVLGKHWRRADERQRERFTNEFRTLLVRTYATALNEYADTTISYLPLRAAGEADDVTVRTEAEVAGGLPVPVDYKLHLEGGEWKVYDVAIDGLSLVTNYRSSFASEIRESSVDGLITKLSERNRQGN
ncbi:ABC transporter substrate-binding protein [Endothiovibrio diazotrophicus]